MISASLEEFRKAKAKVAPDVYRHRLRTWPPPWATTQVGAGAGSSAVPAGSLGTTTPGVAGMMEGLEGLEGLEGGGGGGGGEEEELELEDAAFMAGGDVTILSPNAIQAMEAY